LQPIADAVKLLLNEDIIPAESDKAIFWFAPCVSTITALSAFAVIPFAKSIFVADVNVGLLVVSAMSAVGILGIVLSQLNRGVWGVFANYGFMIVPFGLYIIAATAETNRAPFDMPEAESEL